MIYKQSMHRLCVIILLGLLIISPHSSLADCSDPANVQEVADGIYVRQGQHGIAFQNENLANIGFIVGQNCVAVIDSGGSPKEGRALRCAIEQTTTVPVCYLIISHHHFDHSLGSSAFKSEKSDDIEIIAHSKMNQALNASAEYYLEQMQAVLGDEASEEIIVLADRSVEPGAPVELDLGGRILSLTAHPTAHTSNDLSILDRQTGTLWLADLLFIEHTPALEGSINGWIEVLDELSSQHAQQAVPGHGPVQVPWPQGLDDEKRYLNTVRDEVRQLIEQGAFIEEARDTAGQSERERWQLFDHHHKRNVIRAYTELEWE